MLNFVNSTVEMIDFDPDILGVGVSFLSTAGKYAFFFGISAYLLKMLIKASTGKERFI